MRNLILGVSLLALTACGEGGAGTVREQQAQEAARVAQTVDFSAGNAERENVLRRGQLVSQPDLVGYVVLLNFGQPIAYYTVRGKISSSGKRLERPSEERCGLAECGTWEAPSYDGTYGSSDPYVFFWTTQGQYVQWSGDYIYSDQPLQLSGRTAAIIAPRG